MSNILHLKKGLLAFFAMLMCAFSATAQTSTASPEEALRFAEQEFNFG